MDIWLGYAWLALIVIAFSIFMLALILDDHRETPTQADTERLYGRGTRKDQLE